MTPVTAMLEPAAVLLRVMQDASPLFNPALLLLSIITPLMVALALAISGPLSGRAVKAAAAFGFALPALLALWLTACYLVGGHAGGYAFVLRAPLGLERFGIELYLGLNGIALPLYLLAGIVGLAAGWYAIQSGVAGLRAHLILLLVMHGGLLGVFSSIDLFFFYFFHEFALIPTFILIAGWGRAGRRTIAIELTIYLTLGAMLTLAGLIALYVWSGAEACNLPALHAALVDAPRQGIVFGLLLIGFGILVSLFPFHTWAPRGYATAPAPVAMLHAGVLKKFGLYGLIQIALPLLPQGMEQWSGLLLWLALGNLLLIGLVTIAQRDLKLMLGHASVMHMGYAFLGLYAWSVVGVAGAVLMLFAHGLSVALLFLLADVVEKRAGTSDMSELGGLGQKAPVLMAFFVAATMASIGLPGFANFWGELGIFVALWGGPHAWVAPAAVAGIVISAVYGLRAVAAVFAGEATREYAGGDLRLGEKAPALLLLILLFAVGIWPRWIADPVNEAVARQFADRVAPAQQARRADYQGTDRTYGTNTTYRTETTDRSAAAPPAD
jgi:NADH-quinone oxidoreductase subunit M